jgi:alkanesulfonate monooxygenase SsuD/methylene tetrahydromethanopterin reductase-like flavin-dependent oxidoreductase (luciferase family)
MVALAVEIADGVLWANGARSFLPHSLAAVPTERLSAGYLVANMIPTVIDEDRAAAAALHRRNLTSYMSFPNYRHYWRAAGYVEEMDAIEQALADGDTERIPSCMSDAWLEDCTLFGSVDDVRDGLEAWRAAGLSTPIVVPSSTRGGQFTALREVFAAFS